jgi:hypothetical protein
VGWVPSLPWNRLDQKVEYGTIVAKSTIHDNHVLAFFFGPFGGTDRRWIWTERQEVVPSSWPFYMTDEYIICF